MTRVAVVGGGLLGMATAVRLRRGGLDVEVLEAAPSTGGLAAHSEIGDFNWDRFYHVILLSDANLLALLRDLGLETQIHWSTTKTGFFANGTLYSLSSSFELLRFPILSIVEKVRLVWTILIAARIQDGAHLEKIPIADWLVRLSGQRVFDRIWLPLLKSKLGNNYRVASAAFIWAIIQRMYAARRTGLKKEMLGYVEGGYRSVLDRLQGLLDDLGITTRCGVIVKNILNENGEVVVHTRDDLSFRYNAAVLTIPTPVIAEILPQLSREESRRFSGVTYQGIICASVLLRRPLADFYVTNILDDWIPFTGVIEMTTLVDPNCFGGNSLVYLPMYLTQEDPYWNKSDKEVQADFVRALARMYPEFEVDDILDFRVSRARNVLAVSTLEYSKKWMPRIGSGVEGVFVLNSAQIANGTLNVNETLGVLEQRFPDLLDRVRTHVSRNSFQHP